LEAEAQEIKLFLETNIARVNELVLRHFAESSFATHTLTKLGIPGGFIKDVSLSEFQNVQPPVNEEGKPDEPLQIAFEAHMEFEAAHEERTYDAEGIARGRISRGFAQELDVKAGAVITWDQSGYTDIIAAEVLEATEPYFASRTPERKSRMYAPVHSDSGHDDAATSETEPAKSNTPG
jgi:hypothetical protein